MVEKASSSVFIIPSGVKQLPSKKEHILSPAKMEIRYAKSPIINVEYKQPSRESRIFYGKTTLYNGKIKGFNGKTKRFNGKFK